jgi:8-oxo-dGTP pyrophosphatase MutT (NUDIX family)
MMDQLDMDRLRQALDQDLPGEAAKQRWFLRPRRAWVPDRRPRRASVLVLLVRGNGEIRLPLMRRCVVEGDLHSGQISLPGGGRESGESALAAALRETREEIGVDVTSQQVLGSLSAHRIPVSGYEVTPFVAAIEGPVGYWRDPREVESIFEVPLRSLLDASLQRERPMRLRGQSYRVPGWELGDGFLWGATAMILGEFLEVVRKVLPETSLPG